MKYKVNNVIMHTSLVWSGVVPGDKTINDTKIKGLVMTWDPSEGVIRMVAKGREEIVPVGSVANFSLAPVTKAEK